LSVAIVDALPESFVIDGDGRLVWHRTGGVHGDLDPVRQAIGQLVRRR
jgi:streptogramin lyase